MTAELTRALTVVVMTLTCIVPASAKGVQATATVVVEVTSDGRPFTGATVSIAGRTVTTDAQGRATVRLEPGAVELVVTASRHAVSTRTASVTAGTTTIVQVALEPLPELEEEVFVTATRTNTRLQDQPLRVEVIDREEIEEKALMTPPSADAP